MTTLYWEIVDLRDEIAKYEREHRPFPPKSGSVTKAKIDTELKYMVMKLKHEGPPPKFRDLSDIPINYGTDPKDQVTYVFSRKRV